MKNYLHVLFYWLKQRTISATLPTARMFTLQRIASDKWCEPLNAPIWVTTTDHINADDLILGIYLDQQAWALPWWRIARPHVANLILNEKPVLVTLCRVCSGAAAFYSFSAGQYYRFYLVGQYNGTMLIADEQTNSLWSPFTGEALAGSCKGQKLRRLPLSQCLWAEWQTAHPNTQVLSAPQTTRQGFAHQYSPGSPGIEQSFCETLVRPIDERLAHNTLVLGVEMDGYDNAYTLTSLDEAGRVLNDCLGDSEIVILHQPKTLQALAFSRRVANELLIFVVDENGDIYDSTTQTRWNLMGEAVSGKLAGQSLTYLPSGIEEWYVWAAYHPKTSIYGSDD